MAIVLSVSVSLTDDWDTKVTPSDPTVTPTDECRMGLFGVKNITDKVTEAFRNRLRDLGGQIDGQLRAAALTKSRVAAVWQTLGKPIRIQDGMWLVLNPDQMVASQPQLSSTRIQISAGLVARPVVVVGAEPTPASTPLPKRVNPLPTSTFAVHVPVEVSFDVIKQQLRRALNLDGVGVRVPPNGKNYIQPTDIDLQGFGKQLVVSMAVTGRISGWGPFSRKVQGNIYLTGTPSYDGTSGLLSVPDLDFTIESKQFIVKVADLVMHDSWREQLRGQIRLNIRQQIEDARTMLFRTLNSQQGSVKLNGVIDNFGLVGVWTDPSKRTVRLVARSSGSLAASVVP